MTPRKLSVLFWLLVTLSSWVTPANAGNPFGQTVQINTHFRGIMGKPVWLLVLRDVDSGVVTPYMYDIKNDDNFWLALSFGRNYIITASTLKFGPFAIIHNFCHLENGILSGQSMTVNISGDLTPASVTSKCRVLKYKDTAFNIAP